MNTALFFEPVDDSLMLDHPKGTFGASVSFLVENSGLWKTFDIALFSIGEHGSKIREQLFNLKKGNGAYNIVDLGELKPGETPEDTSLRLAEVSKALLASDVIPFILGDKNSYAFGQYAGFEGYHEAVNMVNVDASFDLEEGDDLEKGYLTHLFEYGESFLSHYAHIAYQSYLVDIDALKVFEKLNFEGVRLGEVRQQMQECEPIVRAANMMTFDVSAIKHSDFPANGHNVPFGLTGEESCQMLWYAGLSNRLRSVGVYGYDLDQDNTAYSQMILATMVWYFVEGYYARLDDMDFDSDHYFKYVISFEKAPHEIVFYKHKTSGKWWMLIDPELKHNRRHVIPCSYQDYQLANTGELPERWMKASTRVV